MKYISIAEAAKRWGIDSSRVGRLVREGRIDGAIKVSRNWLIPESARKPADGRTRQVKSDLKQNFFRFPLYVNSPENSFSPSLTEEELLLRKAQIDYYACNFEKAQQVFDRLSKYSENNYTRIISLFYLCSLAVEAYGGDNYIYYSNRLQLELANDFPYKKEMSLVTPWLYTIMVKIQAVSDSLIIDPLYDYSTDVQPLITCLSFYHLSKDFSSKSEGVHLDIYEISCRQLMQGGHYYEACEMHFLLFLAYYIMMEKDKMLYHLKEGLNIVKIHKFYIIAASYEPYYQEVFDAVLNEMPEDFAKHIKDNSAIISKSIGRFTEKYSNNDIFNTLSKNDYLYLILAVQGNSNKQVANALDISERTVAAKYAVLYEKLGVKGKKQLVELCADVIYL